MRARRKRHRRRRRLAGRAVPPTPARELVSKYCITCHNERLKTAGLLLDKADSEQICQLGGDMGKGHRAAAQPGDAALEHAAAGQCDLWRCSNVVGDRTGSSGARAGPIPGVRLDSIGSIESNTPTLFATCSPSRSIPPSMLPPDAQAHGFDTNADALGMEPALLDRYLTAAAKIARAAVGDPTMRPAVERYTAVKGNSNEQTWLWQTERLGEAFSLGSRGGIAARHYFPLDGEYVLQSPLAANVCRRDPWTERTGLDRDSCGWSARRTVHDRWRGCCRERAGCWDRPMRPIRRIKRMTSCRCECRSKPASARWSRRSSSPTASRRRDWDRRASRSGTAKATCRAPSSRFHPC